MDRIVRNSPVLKRPVLKTVYLVSTLFLVITGFGQMPIYKRYYIADIPGLGWLADFYVTHFMHYVFAAIFIGAVAYALTAYILIDRKRAHINLSGLSRGIILAGITLSGIFLVIFNFESVSFPQGVVIFFVLTHLGLAIIFLLLGLGALIFRSICPIASFFMI